MEDRIKGMQTETVVFCARRFGESHLDWKERLFTKFATKLQAEKVGLQMDIIPKRVKVAVKNGETFLQIGAYKTKVTFTDLEDKGRKCTREAKSSNSLKIKGKRLQNLTEKVYNKLLEKMMDIKILEENDNE